MSQTEIPKMSEFAEHLLKQAQSRDETVNTFDCKCSGKDGKSFWFMLGYNQGYIDTRNTKEAERQT